MASLSRYVCVEGPDGMCQFGPGDDVPEWAAKLITNPNAWAEEPEPAEKESTSGTGSTGRRRSTARASADDT